MLQVDRVTRYCTKNIRSSNCQYDQKSATMLKSPYSEITRHSICKELRLKLRHLGRVVRKPVSANPGLNFNPGFFIFLS